MLTGRRRSRGASFAGGTTVRLPGARPARPGTILSPGGFPLPVLSAGPLVPDQPNTTEHRQSRIFARPTDSICIAPSGENVRALQDVEAA
jgi:hypothetical protein